MRWCAVWIVAVVGCGGRGGKAPEAGGALSAAEGSWVDDGGATYTFDRNGSCQSVVDHDGEVFVVTLPGPVDGALHWVYEVPSTGYVVTHTIQDVRPDAMTATWSNTEGNEGSAQFTRPQ